MVGGLGRGEEGKVMEQARVGGVREGQEKVGGETVVVGMETGGACPCPCPCPCPCQGQ